MITFHDLLLWTPFVVLAFATVLYVILSWRYWFTRSGRQHPAE